MKNNTHNMIKVITLLVLVVVVATLEAFWLQSILEHFNASVNLLTCMAIVIVLAALQPKAVRGLLLLSLFVTQCYIWIF